MSILLTGGCGYIGSHLCIKLLEEGYEVIIIDNLINSNIEIIDEIEKISKRRITKFYNFNLCDRDKIDIVFNNHSIFFIIHMAGFKSVSESSRKPLDYYRNNLISSINLMEAAKKNNVKNFIFSSSATLYDDKMPVTEESHIKPINPYGRTKWMIEEMLKDLWQSDNSWNIISLRYFNPVGDDSSRGENLFPCISKVLNGESKCLNIFGNDYNTKDGTAIRDYIYITDLVDGHLIALKKIRERGYRIYNLGTGMGYTVLEIINKIGELRGEKIPYKFVERRMGDMAICYADVSKAKRELEWEAKSGLEEICKNFLNN